METTANAKTDHFIRCRESHLQNSEALTFITKANYFIHIVLVAIDLSTTISYKGTFSTSK